MNNQQNPKPQDKAQDKSQDRSNQSGGLKQDNKNTTDAAQKGQQGGMKDEPTSKNKTPGSTSQDRQRAANE